MSEGLTMKEFTLSDVDQTLMELKAMRSDLKGPYWDAALMDAIKLIHQQNSEIAGMKVLLDEIKVGDKIVDDAIIALYEAVEALCGREVPLDEAIMLGQSAMAKASFIRANL